jgi:CelD/BcsL family acetyltransferase involved in cellulose biosynthesis
MHIDVFEDFATFDKVRANWDAVYEADPEANFQLSWAWFNIYFRKVRSHWFVVALKPTASAKDYVAFFPFQLRTEMNKDGSFYNEIRMGGAEFSDYRGFICRPEFEDEAAQTYVNYLRGLNWRYLQLGNIRMPERRLRPLVKPFARTQFIVQESENIDGNDGTIHSICPYADLPDTWDGYLENCLSANTRQKARRFLKRADEGKEFRVTVAQNKTEVERDLKTLFKFWELKWRKRKGDRTQVIINTNRIMLMGCFEAGSLFLPVLWQGDRPLAALATILDQRKKAMLFLITGRDETFNSPPPGFVLHAHSIRWAIQNGYKTYDFLQGNESYKYLFATGERRLKIISIRTKNKENLGGVLDARCLPYVLEEATKLHKEGKLAEAERGYRQILAVDPRHSGALYLLAQLEVVRSNHESAERLFKTYIEVKPHNADAWFRLGQTQQARADTAAAIHSYRKVLELEPRNQKVPAILFELQLPAHSGRAAPKLKLEELLRT